MGKEMKKASKAVWYRQEKIKEVIEVLAVLALGFVLMFGILIKSGTLKSGYHFMDDHELIRIEYTLENTEQSVGSLMHAMINNDFHWRFRPFYWVERVGCTAVFGSDLLPWNIYTGIKGVLAFAFLVLAARKLKFGRVISFLFAAIIMFGPQFTPWYRSANQENTGLLLCALVLWLISMQYHMGKYNGKGWNAAIIISIIICGLVKESFTLCMPAFAAFKFWLEYTETPGDKLWKCLRRNWVVYASIAVAFLCNVLWILFRVGVDNVSYAGFQEGTRLSEYFDGIWYSLTVFLKQYAQAGIILLVILVVVFCLLDKSKRKKYAGYALIGGYVMGVQLVAHAKSLMWERYLIPFIIGYAMVFILLGYKMLEKREFIRTIYVGILIVLLAVEAPVAYEEAQGYAYTGQMTDKFLQFVKAYTEEDDVIIGAFVDDELNLATACWLEVNGRTGEFQYSWTDGSLRDTVQIGAAGNGETQWQLADAALCYAYQEDQIKGMMGEIEGTTLKGHVYGSYCVIFREQNEGTE